MQVGGDVCCPWLVQLCQIMLRYSLRVSLYFINWETTGLQMGGGSQDFKQNKQMKRESCGGHSFE